MSALAWLTPVVISKIKLVRNKCPDPPTLRRTNANLFEPVDEPVLPNDILNLDMYLNFVYTEPARTNVNRPQDVHTSTIWSSMYNVVSKVKSAFNKCPEPPALRRTNANLLDPVDEPVLFKHITDLDAYLDRIFNEPPAMVRTHAHHPFDVDYAPKAQSSIYKAKGAARALFHLIVRGRMASLDAPKASGIDRDSCETSVEEWSEAVSLSLKTTHPWFSPST
jgi:hypothetical protein